MKNDQALELLLPRFLVLRGFLDSDKATDYR
jgi:hypothetical protein